MGACKDRSCQILVTGAVSVPVREGFKRLLVSPARAHEIAAASAKAKVRFEQMEGQDIARHLPAAHAPRSR